MENVFVFWLAIIFLLLAAAFSRAETLPIKTYTSADGLIYEGVQRTYQDSRGFLWFCTPVGVSRFDGYQFTSYAMEDGLPHPAIVDVVEDERGIYWLGNNNRGVYRFDPRNFSAEKFVLYQVNGSDAAANEVNLFHKSNRGEIFVATEGGVFF